MSGRATMSKDSRKRVEDGKEHLVDKAQSTCDTNCACTGVESKH
jgi:hypothetical protein